jgi:hypothetical protein
MKNLNKKLILAFALLGVILISNCKKDNNTDDPTTSETTVAEDKQNIDKSIDNILTGIKDLKNGDASFAFKDFVKLSGGEILNDDWVETITGELDYQFNFDDIADAGRFDFNFYTGTYIWNNENEEWDKTNSPNDKIILQFPSQMNQQSNNSVFTMDSYSDQHVDFNGDEYWAPTKLSAELFIDNMEIFHININNIQYELSDYTIPIDIDIELFTKPYLYQIDMHRNTSTNFDLNISMHNNGNYKLSVKTNVILAHSDYSNFDFGNDINTVSGSISYDNFMFKFSGDVGTLASLEDPSEIQINTLIDVEVFYDNSKIGDLEYRKDNGEVNIFIIYKDGTSENTSKYYDDFLDRLELILFDFTGEWKKSIS